MNFLLLTNNDTDGVGQQAINLNKNLKKKGHNSKVVVLHKQLENKNIIKVKRSFVLRVILYCLNIFKKDFFGLFSFGFSTVKYSNLEKYINKADVIIIYSLYKMISNDFLKYILKSNKKVYFRPLDMELLTGGCHANIDNKSNICQKFRLDCDNCPQLNSLNIFNFSANNLAKKKEIFNKNKPKIFVPNNFAKNYFKKSSIFKNIETKTLFSSTDLNRIKFYNKKKARKLLSFKNYEKIILFISFDLDSPHKGANILKNSLKKIISKIDKKKFEKIRLVTVGRKSSFSFDIKGIHWTHLGLVKSIKKLNLLYRSADLLACPSTYDTGPHCVTEALLNDLPVVAFDQGVAHDTVIDGYNGYLVKCFDKPGYAKSIYKELFLKKIKRNNTKLKKIKNYFNPLNEANSIIKIAKMDSIEL